MAKVDMPSDSVEKAIVSAINQNERKPAEQIVSGEVKEISKLNKIGADFTNDVLRPIMGGAVSDIASTILGSICDAAINALDIKIFGEPRHRRGTSFGRNNLFTSFVNNTYTNYSNYSRPNMASPLRSTNIGNYPSSSGVSRGYNVNPLVFQTRGEAEIVRDSILEAIDVYGSAAVADLYKFCGMPTNAMDFKYGWHDFNTSQIRRSFEDYLLIVPRPEPIN